MTTRNGYNPEFLGKGLQIALPTFSEELEPDVVKVSPEHSALEHWLPYINYSVATNKARRQPICCAFNIDQNLKKSTERIDWSVEDRIDAQLDNDYYRNNDWDRGHMVMRSNASWGTTPEKAQEASDDTFFYTNACLQHANLNQDEWLEAELWVSNLQDDDNGKISSFTGPIYGYEGVAKQYITPSGRDPAEIPAAFYKIVAFIDKETKALSTRAFIMVQDAKTIQDKMGKKYDGSMVIPSICENN